jgi:hypothetical protein
MGRIREEIKHNSGAELMVVERQGNECREPWHFVRLDVDGHSGYMSPKELRDLGRWLIAEGKRMGKQYKSNGAPKAAAVEA